MNPADTTNLPGSSGPDAWARLPADARPRSIIPGVLPLLPDKGFADSDPKEAAFAGRSAPDAVLPADPPPPVRVDVDEAQEPIAWPVITKSVCWRRDSSALVPCEPVVLESPSAVVVGPRGVREGVPPGNPGSRPPVGPLAAAGGVDRRAVRTPGRPSPAGRARLTGATVTPVAYPDDLLVSGEQIVMHKHPHWKMLVAPVVALLVVVALGTFLAALVRAQTWAPWGWIALAVVGLGVVGRFTLWPVLRWRTTHFVITTRRVLIREGVLSRHGIDIPMSRINSVRFRHTLVERLLGCGTLIIESASDEPLEFDDVPGVERVHALLYQEVSRE